MVGGGITVAFTSLIELEIPWLHILAVAALTVIGTLIIYTVDVLDYPFDDNLQVGPGTFEMVLGSIEESGSRGSRTSTLSKRPERGVSGVERCRLSIAGEVAQRER
jgi:hypothetical protein